MFGVKVGFLAIVFSSIQVLSIIVPCSILCFGLKKAS